MPVLAENGTGLIEGADSLRLSLQSLHLATMSGQRTDRALTNRFSPWAINSDPRSMLSPSKNMNRRLCRRPMFRSAREGSGRNQQQSGYLPFGSTSPTSTTTSTTTDQGKQPSTPLEDLRHDELARDKHDECDRVGEPLRSRRGYYADQAGRRRRSPRRCTDRPPNFEAMANSIGLPPSPRRRHRTSSRSSSCVGRFQSDHATPIGREQTARFSGGVANQSDARLSCSRNTTRRSNSSIIGSVLHASPSTCPPVRPRRLGTPACRCRRCRVAGA